MICYRFQDGIDYFIQSFSALGPLANIYQLSTEFTASVKEMYYPLQCRMPYGVCHISVVIISNTGNKGVKGMRDAQLKLFWSFDEV